MAVKSVPAHAPSSRDLHGDRSRRFPGSSKGPGRRAPGPKAGGQARAAAGPAGAGLGKNAKTAAEIKADRQHKRAEKYDARRRLGTVTSLKRLAKCGKVSCGEEGEVLLRAGADNAGGYGGLTTCGSVWACPVCSAKISARRAVELTQLIEWNADRGGSVGLLTLTMQHHAGQRLRVLRRALTAAWRHVTSSRGWKEARKELGLDGYVRAIECTRGYRDSEIGDNGWHLHIHALLIFDGPISNDMVDLLAEEVWTRWSEGLSREGMTASRKHGVDVRVGTEAVDRLGKYINKLAFETVGGRWKKNRKNGRTPFEILAEGLATGLADDWDLWFEWEQGSKGMRQLTWSRGLKGRVGLDDKTDEEIADETERGETIAILPARTWRKVYPIAEQLLEALENGGPEAAYLWLEQRRLVFDVREPTAGPPG